MKPSRSAEEEIIRIHEHRRRMLGAPARAARSLQTQDRQRHPFADGKVTLPYETYIAPHTRPVSKIRRQL
jgi:hypothetical protein